MILPLILLSCFISPIFGALSVTSVPSELVVGEKPVYDRATNSVYYIDLFNYTFCRYSLDDDEVYKTSVDQTNRAAFITPIQGEQDRFLVGLGGETAILSWDGVSPTATTEAAALSMPPTTTFNSFMVDESDQFFFGGFGEAFCQTPATMPLYQYTRQKATRTLGSHYNSTVGLALDEQAGILYALDTCAEQIWAMDYNKRTGRVSNERIFYRFALESGQLPCGLAVDDFGFVYSGIYNKGSVAKIDPHRREIVDEIPVGTPLVTSASFGGPNRDILIVTTASLHVDYVTGSIGETLSAPAGNLFLIQGISQGNEPRKPRL